MREINFEDFPAPGRLETPMKSADEPFRLSTSRSNPEGILEPCKASMLVAPLVVAQDAHDTTSCVRSPMYPARGGQALPWPPPAPGGLFSEEQILEKPNPSPKQTEEVIGTTTTELSVSLGCLRRVKDTGERPDPDEQY